MDAVKPNHYGLDEKVRWLSYIDATIKREIIDTHETPVHEVTVEENVEERTDTTEKRVVFTGYTMDDMSAVLLVPFPHDELYIAYLKAKIDEENGETARYNNSVSSFNSLLSDFAKAYNREHMPISTPFRIYKGVRY